MKKLFENRMLLLWMMTYIMIGLVSVIAVVLSYSISSRIIYKETVNTNRALLSQTQKELDEMIASIEKVVVLSSGNETLREISKDEKEMDEYRFYRLKEASEAMAPYFESLAGVEHAFFYLKNQERILRADASPAGKDFYHMLAPDCTYLQWEEFIGTDTKNFLTPIPFKNGETYFLYVGSNYYKRAFGNENIAFCALIRRDGFELPQSDMKLFLKANATGESVNVTGDLSLPDELLPEPEGKVRLGGKTYLCTVRQSEIWQISYVMLKEEAAMFRDFHRLQRVHFIIFVLLIAFVGIFSYWFANQHSRSWMSVLEAFGKNSSVMRKPDLFRNAQKSIAERVQSYESSLKDNREQLQKLRENYLIGLCVAYSQNAGIRRTELQKYGFDFPYPNFSVSILYPNTEENFLLYAYTLKHIAYSVLETRYKILMGERDCFVICILNYDGGDAAAGQLSEITEAVAQMVELVQETIGDRLGEQIYYTVSGTVDSLEKLPQAYNEAFSAMDEQLMMEEHGMHEVSAQSKSGSLTGNKEQALIRAIQHGDEVTAVQLVHETFFAIKNNQELSGFGTRCFVYDMFCTLLHAAFGMGQEAVEYMKRYEFVQKMKQTWLEKEYLRLVLDCAKGLCRLTEGRLGERPQRNQGILLEEKVTQYIYDNYQDFDMGLQKIAEFLNMNPAYISTSFKEQCGEGIMERLEKYRMIKAIDLLEQGEPVKRVAELVGYQNVRTFSKAFKRNYNMPPSKFQTK